MTDQVPTAEVTCHETADENRALQAARDARVQFALEAPELARRLLAIATNDEHAKQLEAIKLALGYSLGAPTVRVEAQVHAQATMSPEIMQRIAEGLESASAVFEAKGRTPPHLLAGDEVVPRPGEIEASMAQLEERPASADVAPPKPRPPEPAPYRNRFEREEDLRRRNIPGTPIRS